ncbi:hypothetical protein BGW42_002620 [Actinomortierella wolfii]|nr:hypothetical protein BGW42_002620 [Actinomortierella wolfii]
MPVAVLKGLRIFVSILYFGVLVLHLISIALLGVNHGFRGSNWTTWVGILTLTILFVTYCNAIRAVYSMDRMDRACSILALCGLLLFMVGVNIRDGIVPGEDYYRCDNTSPYMDECVVDRIRLTVAIVAAFFSIVEVIYTYIKGPLGRPDSSRSEADCENVITVSPPEHPYGIQPNMVFPLGESTPHDLQQQQEQPLALYQQPLDSRYLHPGALSAMTPAISTPGAISGIPLHPLSENQQYLRRSIFKHEEPSSQGTLNQSPHPYSPQAYSEPLPVVANVSIPGTILEVVSIPGPIVPEASSSRMSSQSIAPSTTTITTTIPSPPPSPPLAAPDRVSQSLEQTIAPFEEYHPSISEPHWQLSAHDIGPPPPYHLSTNSSQSH